MGVAPSSVRHRSVRQPDTEMQIRLRELIQRMGDISDSAENVACRLEIISLKKRI